MHSEYVFRSTGVPPHGVDGFLDKLLGARSRRNAFCLGLYELCFLAKLLSFELVTLASQLEVVIDRRRRSRTVSQLLLG